MALKATVGMFYAYNTLKGELEVKEVGTDGSFFPRFNTPRVDPGGSVEGLSSEYLVFY
jgi:hypothetical protein